MPRFFHNRQLSIINGQLLKRGFTLIELLVVIVIIAILATLLTANFVGVRQRGRDATRKSNLRQIQTALELYRSDIGLYPLTAAFPACGNPFSSGTTTYMQKIPCDPLLVTTSYTYTSTDGVTYTLRACLENANDFEKDNPNVSCTSPTTVSYTLTNP